MTRDVLLVLLLLLNLCLTQCQLFMFENVLTLNKYQQNSILAQQLEKTTQSAIRETSREVCRQVVSQFTNNYQDNTLVRTNKY